MLAVCIPTVAAQVKVTADFAEWEDEPLVKKIGVYETPIVIQKVLERDMPKLAEIDPRIMRYEIAWGKEVDRLFAQPTFSGTKDDIKEDYTGLDYFFDTSYLYCPSVMMSHGYSPSFLNGGDWRNAPDDYDAWYKVNNLAASHWLEKGYSNNYVEIWNEPDLFVFSTFGLDEYKKIYDYGARGVRDADADVKIGGPVAAFNGDWIMQLSNYVKETGLPLDFFSGHAYGNATGMLDALRNAKINLGNPEVEICLTEFAPYPTEGNHIKAGGEVERAEAAMTFFNSIPTFLQYHDLSYVTWAQWIDPVNQYGNAGGWMDKMGLVDGNNGARKALFNAFKLYGWMPADRRKSTTSASSGINTLASGNSHCVALVAWTQSTAEKPIEVELDNIPFGHGTIEVYYIDESRNSYYETKDDSLTPELVEEVDFSDGKYRYSGTMGKKGVFFIRAYDNIENAQSRECKTAKIIRTHAWNPHTSASAPYASFDTKTWTAHLLMGNNRTGDALTAVTAENVPARVHVFSERSRETENSGEDASLSLRIDYQSADGDYVRSVVFKGRGLNGKSAVAPWGTRREADETVEVADFSDFIADLKAYEPGDFSGRVIFTFGLSDAPRRSKANIHIEDADAMGSDYGITTPNEEPLRYEKDSDCLVVCAAPTQSVSIFDIAGICVLSVKNPPSRICLDSLPKGRCYIARCENKVLKFMK